MAQEVPATPVPDVHSPISPLNEIHPAASLEIVLATPSQSQATPEFVLATPTPPHLEAVPEDNNICSFDPLRGHDAFPVQTEENNSNNSEPEENNINSSEPAPEHDASPVHSEEEEEDGATSTLIFIPRMLALLLSPSLRSTPPRPPSARRKTLAGVTGFHLPWQSPQISAKKRKMPIARLAEQLLCHRMGVVVEGEQVTETAIAKFAEMFQGRLPDIAVVALRALFQLDCDLSSAVEDALMQHGGEGGPDLSEAATVDA